MMWLNLLSSTSFPVCGWSIIIVEPALAGSTIFHSRCIRTVPLCANLSLILSFAQSLDLGIFLFFSPTRFSWKAFCDHFRPNCGMPSFSNRFFRCESTRVTTDNSNSCAIRCLLNPFCKQPQNLHLSSSVKRCKSGLLISPNTA